MKSISKYLENKRTFKIKDYINGDVLDLGCGPVTVLKK
jgi:hypothetical protein